MPVPPTRAVATSEAIAQRSVPTAETPKGSRSDPHGRNQVSPEEAKTAGPFLVPEGRPDKLLVAAGALGLYISISGIVHLRSKALDKTILKI